MDHRGSVKRLRDDIDLSETQESKKRKTSTNDSIGAASSSKIALNTFMFDWNDETPLVVWNPTEEGLIEAIRGSGAIPEAPQSALEEYLSAHELI